jgi:hypothetical protein
VTAVSTRTLLIILAFYKHRKLFRQAANDHRPDSIQHLTDWILTNWL